VAADTRRRDRWPAGIVVGVATFLAALGIGAAVLISPPAFHFGLDEAGSAAVLGLSREDTLRASDLTVRELVAGPGTFAFAVPQGGPTFYDPSEASHLRDVRVVLAGFLAVFAVAFTTLAIGYVRSRHATWFWRAVGAGAALVVVGLGVLGGLLLVAFDPLFTVFHLVFFPGGNWAFNPTTERMVQLYPTAFWEYAAVVLAVVGVGVGALVWWFARRQLRRVRETSR
jgi:integral membrane protein (TIGR01906 family)